MSILMVTLATLKCLGMFCPLTHSLTHLTSIHIPYAWIQCLGHLQQGVQKMRVKHPTMAPLLPAKYVIEYEPP